MATTKKKLADGIATIDVEMVVIRTGKGTENVTEIAVDTANKVEVKPQIDKKDAIKLIKNGRLLAQKPPRQTVTGHEIKLSDNKFIPELVKILQGGKIEGEGDFLTYEPPVAGSNDKGESFEMDMYTAQYDASGLIKNYEKITYPNCTGTPVAFDMEDDKFRTPDYTINSAPATGEAPYKISYVKALPDFEEHEEVPPKEPTDEDIEHKGQDGHDGQQDHTDSSDSQDNSEDGHNTENVLLKAGRKK